MDIAAGFDQLAASTPGMTQNAQYGMWAPTTAAWGAPAWAGAAPMEAQAAAAGTLVLYNPMGTLAAFNQQLGGGVASNRNPFTPGLAPLPVIPPPKTFVSAGVW